MSAKSIRVSFGCTYCARVDCQTIILVHHDSVANSHTVALADIESISVMSTVVVTIRVINRDAVKNEVVRLDTEGLDGRVLDVQTGDGRVIQVMGIEELGLRLATVSTLAIPPALSSTVDSVVRGTSNNDVGARDLNQGSIPFLVSEGGLAVEDNLSSIILDTG